MPVCLESSRGSKKCWMIALMMWESLYYVLDLKQCLMSLDFLIDIPSLRWWREFMSHETVMHHNLWTLRV